MFQNYHGHYKEQPKQINSLKKQRLLNQQTEWDTYVKLECRSFKKACDQKLDEIGRCYSKPGRIF